MKPWLAHSQKVEGQPCNHPLPHRVIHSQGDYMEVLIFYELLVEDDVVYNIHL